jgi:hypothetical protein
VPKLAATLASLLLIASSIGVNIARYPQVGRTADVEPLSQETAVTQPVAKQPAASQPSVDREAVNGGQPRATVLPENLPQVAAASPKAEPDVETPAAQSPAIAAGIVPQREVPILEVRPMVPVVRLQETGTSADFYGLLRLPPVDPHLFAGAESAPEVPDASGHYPATATP